MISSSSWLKKLFLDLYIQNQVKYDPSKKYWKLCSFFVNLPLHFWGIIFLAEWREPWVRECIAGLKLEREWVCRRGSQEADGIQSRCQILSPTTRANEKITAAEGILSGVVCIYFIVSDTYSAMLYTLTHHTHKRTLGRIARAEGTHEKFCLRSNLSHNKFGVPSRTNTI